ncbi:NAD-dependent epimerase/dehydratase family protein [Chloroflexia bacterium SDU3-3]|nr:NAD-dependent epimerase/dehydratase family protein [Chloroflexia bacterium SDU3-3]
MKYSPEELLGLSPKEKRAILARMLKERSSAKNLMALANADSFAVTTDQLEQYAVLDPAIQAAGKPHAPAGPPHSIFLTGSTGFLGAFLLDELLARTQATIYCLVRADSEQAGLRRVIDNLVGHGLSDHAHEQSRIVPVLGDLAKPKLGMAPQQYAALAEQVQIVYHNGAYVNWIFPYERLADTNVQGAQEVLRFACERVVKPVHHISTLSIFPILDDTATSITESHSLDHGGQLYGGYTQTKWVSEKLMAMARERGLPVCVYRPGMITGHSASGVGNVDDFMSKWLKSWVELGYGPELDMTVDMTPADYVCQGMVHLSLLPERTSDVFHLVNRQPLTARELIDWMIGAGYLVGSMPYEAWRTKLLAGSGQSLESASYALLPLFMLKRAESSFGIAAFDDTQAVNHLAGSDIRCAPLDAELLDTYFAYFVRQGFMPRPREQAMSRGV